MEELGRARGKYTLSNDVAKFCQVCAVLLLHEEFKHR